MATVDINTDFKAWQANMMRFAKRMFVFLTFLQLVIIAELIWMGTWGFITLPIVAISVQIQGRYVLYLRDKGRL